MRGRISQTPLVVKRTAQVYTLADRKSDPSDLWIVLHGYGERADKFLEQFREIQSTDRVICAPEGLSRFYSSGTSGSVGASWMTSADRESEIADYIEYLDLVLEMLNKTYPSIRSITVLGFSQGTSTASRWIAASGPEDINRLILWGGSLAKDIDIARFVRNTTGAVVDIVVGSRDQYIGEQRLHSEIQRFKEADIAYRLHQFHGGHRLDKATLIGLSG